MKKATLAPRTAWRRFHAGPTLDPLAQAMLELHYYADPIFGFFGASADHPTILVDADLDTSSIVVDAGAYVGDWATQISDRYSCTVFAFEPGPGAFERLEAAAADRATIHPFAFALGGRDSRARLELNGPGSSIYASAPSSGGAVGRVPMGVVDVEVRDVVAVFDELGLERIDLLKLNIEGAEYDVLDRLDDAGWLPRIDQVLVQFHEWHPHSHRRRRTNRAALRRDHEEQWNYPWVWERWCLRDR